MKRELYSDIWRALVAEKAMVFMAGPRQAGKTTLARMIADSFRNHLYFNWDIPDQQILLLKNPYFFESVPRHDTSIPLIVFDEVHKYRDWKNYLKGIYDKFHHEYRFLVSGSGRLDIFKRGGDSMAGRYYMFRLWPLTLAELAGKRRSLDDFLREPLQIVDGNRAELSEIWSSLLRVSGFPDPWLSGKETSWRRWSRGYGRQIVREDIRDFAALRTGNHIELLYALLPGKVGAPLSLNGLANDLKVAFTTVQSWMDLFERFFLCFRISPWSARITRAIQKEKKAYLFNTPLISEPGARFENAVALELYRAISNWNDMGWGSFSLHFIRNKEKQEVDFLIADENRPLLLVETKLSSEEPAGILRKTQTILNVPAVQLNEKTEGFKIFANGDQKIMITSAWQWLAGLP